MKKLIFLAGVALGFVIGSASGRGPYEQLEAKAREVSQDPAVQQKAQEAKDKATHLAQDAASTVKEKAPEVAASAKESAAKAGAAASSAAASAKQRVSSSATQDADGTVGGDAEVGDDKPLSADGR